jgi:CrcB protein
MIKQLLLVGLGGGAGSMLRYLSTLLVARHFTGHAPLATFLVNVTGCLLVGLLAGLFPRGDTARLLLLTGFCGGYTTFSAFAAENVALWQQGNYPLLALYTTLSVVAGIAAAWGGAAIARQL